MSIPLDRVLTTYDFPKPELEYKFAAERRWRFDAAWPGYMVALEVDGAVWAKGRHTRGKGFIADQEKLSEAAIRGWIVIRCTPQNLTSEQVIGQLRRALETRGLSRAGATGGRYDP